MKIHSYTVTLTALAGENDEYNFGVAAPIWYIGSPPDVIYTDPGKVLYDGEEWVAVKEGTKQSFLLMDPSNVEFAQYLYTKTDEVKRIRFKNRMVIDFDSLIKTGEINVNKSDLQYEIEFAEHIISTEANKYTLDSIKAYQFHLDKAKAVYDDDSVTQSQVREATQNLKDAWESCEILSNTTTTTTIETTTTSTTMTTTEPTTSTTMVIEDGVYEADVEFEMTFSRYDDPNNFADIYGDKLTVIVEDNQYMLRLNAINPEDDKYWYGGLSVGRVNGNPNVPIYSSTYQNEYSVPNSYGNHVAVLLSPNSTVTFMAADLTDVKIEQFSYPKGDTYPEYTLNFAVKLNIDYENMVKIGEITVDKSELEYEIEFAEHIINNESDKYTSASVANYAAVLENAKLVLNDDSVKQAEVRETVTALKDAWESMVTISEGSDVDTTALEAKLSEVKAISNDDGKYTADSFANLQQFITISEAAVTADDLTQETADQLVILLQNAIDGLVENTVSIDTSSLEAKISEAEAISNDDNKYTEESYTSLQEMIFTAKSALTAEDLTQEYADAFVGLLQDLIDGLEETLPQTGNNSLVNLAAVTGAIAISVMGLAAICKSGVMRKRKEEQ